MTGDPFSGLDRRNFLKATGAVGASAALAPLATGDESAARRVRAAGRAEDPVELVVGVRDESRFEDVEAGLPADAEVLERDDVLLFVRVRLPARTGAYDRLRDQARIADLPGVKFTESNQPVLFGRDPELGDPDAQAVEDPDDPDDPRHHRQYAPDTVNAPDAWEVADAVGNDEEVTVAIVDSGVDYDHPDLQDRFGDYKGDDMIMSTFDGVPYLGSSDDPAPKNPEEDYHGTHVSGIVAATMDNGEGVSGIAGLDGVRLRSYRVTKGSGFGSPTDIAKGIKKAASEGADVINMSLGTPTGFLLFGRAIDHAIDQGTVPIAAAGNMGMYPVPDGVEEYEPKENVWKPAAYDNCLAVSASNSNDEMWDGSKIGEEIDVAAPGQGVYAPLPREYPHGDYGNLTGTSMASPVVTGVAALVVKCHPDLEPAEVHRRIKDSAEEIDGLSEIEQGSGRVDAFRAVAAGVLVDGGEYDRVFYGGLGDAGEETFEYVPETDGVPDRIEVELRADEGTDFDLYVTLDGRTPAAEDYDRADRSGGNEGRVELTREDLDSDTELGIAVAAYEGAGTFSVAVREVVEGAEADGDTDESGSVDLDLDPTAAPGERLAFSAGDVEADAVRWAFDGDPVEGRVASHAFENPGEHTVSLAVERDGEVATASDTIEVTPDSRVGHLHRSDAVEGRADDLAVFVYDPRTSRPEQVQIAVENPEGPADIDLYATLDGRTPTLEDHDLASTASGDRQRLLVEDLDGPVGIAVHRVDGDGRFRLETGELGR